MFKKSRKAKDHDDTLGSLTGSSATPVIKSSRGLTRKKKKNDVEEKPVFDLANALPTDNQFRTSLLLPNLSARFSMLREQDDPNSLLGKASDDSVLFPKRASRMNMFNSNALTDIAEVESIHSTFRPPFADERSASVSEGYASDDGSVMNRSRPTEGNALFGGRQKLYKIATSSTKELSSSRHYYDADVSLSTFQQLRLKEKEMREHQRDQDDGTDRSSFPTTDAEEHDSTHSPMTAFSQNRGTQSSTYSGPSNRRTSTAATSVVSESPLPQQGSSPAVNKIKDLDANSSAESIGFATSPGLRTVIREDGRPTFRLSGSRSPLSMRENYSKPSPVPQHQAFRGISPPLSASPQPLDFSLKDTTRSQPSPARFQATSPTSQFDFYPDDTLAGNVRPNDRGKATAMGLFNKPSRQYDDAQFQQRQVQLHEGRNSPASASSRAASRASPEPTHAERPSFASTHRNETPEGNLIRQIPPIPGSPTSTTSNTRRSSATSANRASGSRPRAKSSASHKEAAMKARVESLIRKQNAELAAQEETQLGPSRSHDTDDEEKRSGGRSTFYDNTDESDYEEDHLLSESNVRIEMPQAPPPPPPSDVHPALREGPSGFDFGIEEKQPSVAQPSNVTAGPKAWPLADKNRYSEHESVLSSKDLGASAGPAAGLGLSGLIRTHLRHDSDKSSLLPPLSPSLPGAENPRGSFASTTRTITESVKSDPFEFDNEKLPVRDPAPTIPEPTVPAPAPRTTLMSHNAHQILEAARALRNAQLQADAASKTESSNKAGSPDRAQVNPSEDLSGHQRSESTDTQREQQRFDEELAERRKRVQETLKSVQERSRSRSPIGERGAVSAGHGFSRPRFPVKPNSGDRSDVPTHKNIKVLGISGPREYSSPRIAHEPPPRDEARLRQNNSRQGFPPHHDSDRPNGRHTPNSGRSGSRPRVPYGNDRSGGTRSTTPSDRPGPRARSTSAGADRSASRNKQIPESDKAMMPGAFPHSPNVRTSPPRDLNLDSPLEHPSERSGSAAAARYAERAGYFGSAPFSTPEINGSFTPRPSPRPSPHPPVEGGFTPTLAAPMSPPSSALPSPNPAAAGPGRTTPSGARKRSVTKGMISEPTFVSSTSTVPLVHLPRDGGPVVQALIPPPLPAMNPRRRGTAGDQSPSTYAPHPAVRPNITALPAMPGSPQNSDIVTQSPPKQRTRLRKSSSEGGSMAARARQQALAVEMALEKERSPNVAVFPNRSATSLHTGDGSMF